MRSLYIQFVGGELLRQIKRLYRGTKTVSNLHNTRPHDLKITTRSLGGEQEAVEDVEVAPLR